MDINLHSFNGPEWNGKSVDWADKALAPGPEISDTLKFTSSLRGFSGRFGTVVGGREDCADFNDHCDGVTVSARWMPKGKYAFTVKGGCKGVRIEGEIDGHGSEVDIDLGNVSDQSDDLTGPVEINLIHVGGEPITFRVLGAHDPVFLNADKQLYRPVLVLPRFTRSMFLKSYKQLKKYHLV